MPQFIGTGAALQPTAHLDPADPTRLFAIGAIDRSDDGGETWTSTRTPFYGRAPANSGEGGRAALGGD